MLSTSFQVTMKVALQPLQKEGLLSLYPLSTWISQKRKQQVALAPIPKQLFSKTPDKAAMLQP